MRARSGPRSVLPLVAVLLLVGLFCVGFGLGQIYGLPSLPGPSDNAPVGGGSVEALGRSVPTRISIPTLGVRAPVVKVGQAADGSIAPPATDPARATGWYRLGPTPGEPGTAVIVGHVDTADQPAVFHRLGELGKGTRIEVHREDRQVATFTVESVETFPKNAFPASRVFATTDRARLVLVTCGGPWVGGRIGYRDNIIVFATLG